MNTLKPTRYVALDVLRGMTVAGMILVNNAGSGSHVFPPLQHASWNGCTPTDLVFPFFLFCVGVAMAFSFAKFKDGLGAASLKKIFGRGALIFLVGLAMNAFPFYPTSPKPELTAGENYIYYLQHIRYLGVLQRIALCYIVGGIVALWLKTPKKIIIGMCSLMLIHTLVLVIFGGEGWSTLEGNVSGRIDVALFGESHVYKRFGVPFDPEGLLGVLSGSGTLLLGYLIGQMIRKTENKIEVVAKTYTIGLISLGIGCILSIWLPINKGLWTPSYVFYAGGWSILMLALFIFFIDVKGKEKIFTPFKAMGMNPLFAFVMAGLFSKIFGRVIKWTYEVVQDGVVVEKTTSAASWFYRNCCMTVFGGNNEYSSLMYALVYVTIFTLMAMWLYKKKIVIKI